MNNLQETVEELLELYQFTESIFHSTLDWCDKFDIIFSAKCSSRIVRLFRDLGTTFDYYDPDTTYEDDCLAFFNYFTQMIKVVQTMLESTPTTPTIQCL